jgi:hypothetical protein
LVQSTAARQILLNESLKNNHTVGCKTDDNNVKKHQETGYRAKGKRKNKVREFLYQYQQYEK